MSLEFDEATLVARLRQRDELAFTFMVRTYQDRVFGLVFRMLNDRAEAEDLAQDVFVTVFKAIDSFRGDSSFSTWLFRIATNHCRNRLKYLTRRHHNRQADIDETPETAIDGRLREMTPRPDRDLEGAQLARIVADAMGELDPDHREVLVLRDVEQLAYDEIAAILEVAEGTVKSRLFRARAALRQRIGARYT